MNLGTRLKTSRESKGFSQERIAKILNVSRQSISKWENNSCYPDIDNILLLSKHYEVSIDELLSENKELKQKIISS